MLQDLNCLFSGAVGADGQRTAQAITATTLGTNILDTRLPGTPALSDSGLSGFTLYLVVHVIQAFNNLTSLTITLESDSSSSLASSPVVHSTQTVALGGLTAGAIPVRMPLASDNWKRYIGARFTVNGANPTQGSVFAYLTDTPPSHTIYRGAIALDV